jgi:hypothetical protein
MRCCGFCGSTKLHLHETHFSVVLNTFGIVVNATPYGCSNIIMSTYTTTSDGLHVYVCNQNESNMLYFKTWIIWNKSLLTICCIFNLFHLLIYQWKLNNKIMDSCMAKYNHLGYLTILYFIKISSFNQLVHQKLLICPQRSFSLKFVFKSFYTKIHPQY